MHLRSNRINQRARGRGAQGAAPARLRSAERRLREQQRRYRMVMDAVNESVYDWDIARGRFSVSRNMQQLLGLSGAPLTLEAWQARIHPDDYARFRDATIAHLKGATERFECDYRYRAADGEWRWARTHGVAGRDRRGRAVRMIGSTGDITGLKLAELELRRARDAAEEALEQQTATSDVLRVISGSLTDLAPVYQAILSNITRLCRAHIAALFLYDGETLGHAASLGITPEFTALLSSRRVRPSRETTTRLAALERRVVHVPDLLSNPSFSPAPRELYERENVRTVLSVPILRDEALVGVITTWRREVRPFDDRQVELVRTFADQAVIAIENARLMRETQEALEQQRASAEVLQAISGSIADTAPVFDKILESCQRLFAGTIVGLNLVREDGMLRIGAYHGAHREEFERIFPLPCTAESGSGLAIIERRVVHYPDAEHGADVPERTRRGCKAIGIRSAIFAPVLWKERGLGAIFVGRDHVSSFAEREISLLRTFADQAAIAIENMRLFNEFQEKSAQLETANRHKSEFLANMSHELRTPLNAIIGFARIVMRRAGPALEAKQYENLERILASGQHLLALINAILDLSKIEAGRVEVQAAEVALAPLLEQCLRTVEPLVRVDAVALVRDFDGTLPSLYADEDKLRQIVINLLSNAAKFTPQGEIRLRARADDGEVAIAVADSGIGVPADKLELIFEEFEQVDASSTREHGGTGLGLAIARRLARLMGGDITAQSARGAGSTFTLRLPLRYEA